MNRDASCAEVVRAAGYGLIPDVFTAEEIGVLLDNLERASLPRSRAGVRHAMKNAGIAQIARDPRMMQVARQILGDAALPFRATLFEKLPDSNWLVAWHQDTALPLVGRVEREGWGPWSVKHGVIYAHAPAAALEQVIALRVHLDNSTEQNGPLRVLPETQRLGVLTDDQIHALSESVEPVDCLMPLGGVVAMRPLVVHASSKSQAGIPRRVLHIEYAASASPADGLQFAIA